MGSALLEPAPLDQAFATAPGNSAATTRPQAAPSNRPTNSAPAAAAEALRRHAAERLAEHRGHRPHSQPQPANTLSPAGAHSTRSARIAAVVAQRYAQSPSYRAFLAAEAERATQQARAAAEIAALNARAVAQAQQQLLDSFAQDSLAQDGLAGDGDIYNQLPDSNNRDPHASAPGNLSVQNGPQDDERTESHTQQPLEPFLWPELDAEDESAGPRHQTHHSTRPHRSAAADRTAKPEARTSALTVLLYQDAADRAFHPPLASLLSASNAHRREQQEQSQSNSALSKSIQGGFYFHPSDEDLSLGARMRKDPFEGLASGYTYSGFALADRDDAEARALDEEIAFRQSPVFEEPAGPPMPLPANLIEFPRHLVATRKARPLCVGAGATPPDGQLRIFEVDPAHISTAPTPAEIAPTPQWTSIWLDAPSAANAEAGHAGQPAHPRPAAGPSTDAVASAVPLPQMASIARRLMAAAIDTSIVLIAFMASAAAFLLATCHSAALTTGLTAGQIAAQLGVQPGLQTGLQPRLALATLVFALAVLVLLYQTLFFTFSDATPGMRAVRIGLCTFDDENPTRRVMRRRILALLVSACPLGLGLLWATLDEDRLAWHDRITRTYQRSY